MRIAPAILTLALTLTCFAGTRTFDLMKIAQLGGKGRIQDLGYQPRDPQVTAILAMGKDAIPLLIDAIESERPYGDPPAPFWPKMVEGDVALVVLSNLFLDPTWQRSTLPELCWDNLLERTSEETPAWELLNAFVKLHGRAELARRWRQAWAQDGTRVRWDSTGKYFRVEGRELTACAPDKSLERTHVTIERLAELGDPMPCTPDSGKRYGIAAAQLSPGCESVVGGIRYFFAENSEHKVIYISVEDRAFRSPEGIAVGSSFAEVASSGAEAGWYETGWAYHSKLPSGWHAAVLWLRPEPPPAESRVDWMFKRL